MVCFSVVFVSGDIWGQFWGCVCWLVLGLCSLKVTFGVTFLHNGDGFEVVFLDGDFWVSCL